MNWIFQPLSLLRYQLYIFQLEEYDKNRFLKSLFQRGLFPPRNLRKKVVWTSKAKLLAVLAFGISLIFYLMVVLLIDNFFHLATLPFVIVVFLIANAFEILSFVFLTQAADIISPLESYLKNKLIREAKVKLEKFPDLKIVGITGSYGKTTMKETIATILNEKFKVVKTEGNNNTPLGIARTITNKLQANTQIFIVEMGEYVKGDVMQICKITPPDFSVITGINEAHLERYGTMENAISTKFEIIEKAKENAEYLLNADDKLIIDNYKNYVKNEAKSYFYSSKDNLPDQARKELKFEFRAQNIEFLEDRGEYTFELFNCETSIGKIKTQILAPYIIGNITAAATLAKHLGMNDTEIRLGISKLKAVEHRLESKIVQNNILVIDDTYNGNSDGIKIGLELLSKFKNRRKVYVTPGLVETGSLTKDIHLEIGRNLAKVADLVILLRNSVTPYIFEGLKEAGFDEKNVIWYDYSKEMYAQLYTHLKDNDVVLMQNDWSDNYS